MSLSQSDFNLNLQVYIIHENGSPLVAWDFPTETAAQGYVDTFGAGRDLEIVHYVKVRDSKRGNVEAGRPVLWVCQEKLADGSVRYVANPMTSKATADFWSNVVYGSTGRHSTKMLAKYVS